MRLSSPSQVVTVGGWYVDGGGTVSKLLPRPVVQLSQFFATLPAGRVVLQSCRLSEVAKLERSAAISAG